MPSLRFYVALFDADVFTRLHVFLRYCHFFTPAIFPCFISRQLLSSPTLDAHASSEYFADGAR